MLQPEIVQFMLALPEASFLVSSSGEILAANDAASELTGKKRCDLSGTRLVSLIKDLESKAADYLRLCARSRQLIPGSFNWTIKNGESLDIRCDGAVIVPRSDESEAVIFIRCRPKAEAADKFILLNEKIAALSREILERKKAEIQRDELLRTEKDARMDAEQNSRIKDEFLATLSHELRTPLNAITGWTHLLRLELAENAQVSEGLEIIERNARIQKQLIEDLLDMSRIISGKVRLDFQRVDLAAIIEQAVASVRPSADAKGISLQLALDPSAGPVKGDPNRLQQVVWNLLTNAIKFSGKAAHVQVCLQRVNSHVEICVSDTGEGIKAEFLPYVFDRFRQADATTTRQHGGLGLGLSIVKQLVELHGGSVRANSPGVGHGSTFIVVLPLMVDQGLGIDPESRVHPAARPAAPAHCETPRLSGIRVLVVDDEPDARELVRRLLEGCEATAITAASAESAFQVIKEQRPDLIISDIGMPITDGYELIRRIRALPEEEAGRIPAIALTAFARSEDRTRAMLAGYQVHLSKPIDPEELVATAASLLGRTGS